jgi:hypothetical protein
VRRRFTPRVQTSIVITDVHAPWHNSPLVKRVCQLAKDIQPDRLVIGGDFADLYSLSRHHKKSLYHLKGLTLTDEYDTCNQVLDDLGDAVGQSCEKDYLWGNHEDFYTRWLHEEDNAKLGGEVTSPTEGLFLRERGYTVQENWMDDAVTLGRHLEVRHGIFCAVHAAKAHLDKFESSVMIGHTHRFNTFLTGSRGAFNIGGLFDKASKGFRYASASMKLQWCNGFAVVYVYDDGSFNAHPINCWNGRFVFNGKQY